MNRSFQRLARRQLSEQLRRYAEASVVPQPRDGWIAALRAALGMTVRQFAARLGVSPSNVSRLERRERDETISLGALRRAANALDCDLVYAVVPRRPASADAGENVLESIIQSRARTIAAAELGRVAHSMALEGQAPAGADLDAEISDRAAQLVEEPRRLWNADLEQRTSRGQSRRKGERRGRGDTAWRV